MKRTRSMSQLPSTSGKPINASHAASNIESNSSQQSQINPDADETWIQCKGCLKKMQEKSILLHLRSKKCKQHYNDNEYSAFVTKRDEVRKHYKQQQKRAKSNPTSDATSLSFEKNTGSNATPTDLTSTVSHSPQQSQIDPGENVLQCKGCPKKILERSILLHLRSKHCRKHYSDEEYSNFITRRDERRKCYFQQHKKINASSIQKKNIAYKKTNASSIQKKNIAYKKTNASSIQKKNIAYQRQATIDKQRKKTAEDRFLAFKRDIVDGPNFVCFSCNRNLFKCSVKTLETKEISRLLKKVNDDLAKETGLDNCHGNSKLILCHSCTRNFNCNKFPSINVNNGLKLDDVPKELSGLADLEQQLIAQLLLFMKIKKLPTTRMGAVVDQVISVPIEIADISRNVSKLPRHPDDAEIIAVKLKRKLEYKSAHLEEFIRPKVVIRALEILKESGNKYYQNIKIDKEFTTRDTPNQDIEDNSNATQIEEALENISDDSEDESEDPVKKFQSNQNSETCLTPLNLETQVVSNITSDTISKSMGEGRGSFEIAPGENKLVKNRLREKDSDVRAFPRHYPTGQYGISFPRKHKLTNQMFFNQRLLNADERFSKDNFYLFMASTFIEEEQLEKQVNISGSMRGAADQNTIGETVLKLHDLYSVFKTLKGTPKYWQTAKYELMAKVKQLGPFHLFFTFSCGEMRWTEVFISILKRLGHTIEYPEKWDGNDAEVLVDGQTGLWEFVNNMSESKNAILRGYSFLITRLFDARVKSFIKNILMANGKDKVNLAYYSYRVEFQARGMPHIHGVAWIEEDELAKREITGYLCDHPRQTEQLAIELISCELPDSDEELRSIVGQVQRHKHTKSCRKYSGSCRFGFPKLPSPKTFMTEPIKDMDDEEKEKLVKKATETLKLAKEILDDPDCKDDMTFEEFLSKVKVNEEDYLRYISIIHKTRTLVLKRNVRERYINKEMIKAWNANMDVQLALDPFAIISYIVGYTCKIEGSLTKFLKEALDASADKDVIGKLRALQKAFFTHRQMGASEAVYRIIPNMKLKDSNISCIFVATGFPENRSLFFRKVGDDENEIQDDESEHVELDEEITNDSVTIEGCTGKYKKSTTVIERYRFRPKCLESMCLAQFAIYYTSIKHPPKTAVFDENGASERLSSKKFYNREEFLPQYVKLTSENLGFLRLRTFPAILRIHSSKKKDGHEHDPKYESFAYTGNLNQEANIHQEEFKYKKICLPSNDELRHITCSLVPEQMNILRPVIGYCKDVIKSGSKANGKFKATPIRMIIHGGAGVGKSQTIRAISLHAEKLLRRSGENPNYPRVLLCAPTGRAASLINGVTIHSAFNFNFGNEYRALGDKQLAEFRENLKHLKILIVDEMSLLGADMLYKIHKRLSEEIFQNKELFGGISVLLVGDLLQIPPVNAVFIFKKPRSSHFAALYQANPIWTSFEPMILKHNHRQGEGGEWANTLNRFREGIVLPEDEEVLRKRIVPEDSIGADSLLICYKNDKANDHNENMIKTQNSPAITIYADKRQPRGCQATITGHGTIDSTRFMDILTIKMGARCTMIYNVNTIDDLVNGAAGTIMGLEYNSTQMLECIIVRFDFEKSGEIQRSKYPHLTDKYKHVNGTPIFRYELEYEKKTKRGFIQFAKARLMQFPLQIHYASTAHRVQGTTVKTGTKVTIFWSNDFANKKNPGMAYVSLGRSERLNDIEISGEFDPKGIHCSPEALAESMRLQQIFDEQVLKQQEQRALFWKISYLNVRSLKGHQKEVESDNYMMDSDVLGFGETHLLPEEEVNFDEYSGHFASSGKWRGTAACVKIGLIHQSFKAVSENYSAVLIKTTEFDTVFLYLSKDFDQECLFKQIDDWIDKTKPTAVIGDMNWDISQDTNMKKFMTARGFSQQIQKPTFNLGTIIDHVYVNRALSDLGILTEQQAAYYTDHDIVTLLIAKK